jgi:hypothetical protein
MTGGKSIAVWSQSISGVSAINPLVAFYDIHGGKREVLFFYFVPETTRDNNNITPLINNTQDITASEYISSFSRVIKRSTCCLSEDSPVCASVIRANVAK